MKASSFDEPRVAIAIPVFNGAQHLRECLASVLDQTYTNWTATIVNNCSTDDTAAIADEFAKRDPRFTVWHCHDFVGQQENYNRAVARIRPDAKYIKIVEGDNVLRKECIASMVCLAEKNSTIGIVGCYWMFGETVNGGGLDYRTEVISGIQAGKMLFNSVYLFGTPTTLLFRAAALGSEANTFTPDVYFDDVELCIRLLTYWNFGFVHQVLAIVRHDNNGTFDAIKTYDVVDAYRYFLSLKYANHYYHEPELTAIRRNCRNDYFNRLGRAMVTARGKDYFAFHRNLFKNCGYRMPTKELLLPAARALMSLGLNPRPAWERFVMRIRKLKCG